MNMQQVISTESGKFFCEKGCIVDFEPNPENVVVAKAKDMHIVMNHLIFPSKEGFTESINATLFDNMIILGRVRLPDNLTEIGNTHNNKEGSGTFVNCQFNILEIPPLVENIGNFAFGDCKIGILKLYPRVLSTEYARQFKGAEIENLYLLESHIPLFHKWGILDSIACNASVGNLYVDNANHLVHLESWQGLLKGEITEY